MNLKWILNSTSLKLVSSDHKVVISGVEGMDEKRRSGLSFAAELSFLLYFGKLLHFTEKRRKKRLKLQAAAEVQVPWQRDQQGRVL